jgi:type III pantothenate kinase
MDRQLLIDVGNGRTKLGLVAGDRIVDRRDCPTPGLTGAGLQATLKGWKFDTAVLGSVVPDVVPVFQSVLGASLTILRHDQPLGIGIRYPKPESIGADRLANAVALVHLHGAPGVVIDFGTAVTFDVVSTRKEYVGGVIAPGLQLMTDYLHQRTALLPHVDLREPPSAIGQSTEGAILAGAAIGYRGMIHGILDALRAELGADQDWKLVATGGDAQWITEGMEESISVEPDLTLHGLRLVGNLARGVASPASA